MKLLKIGELAREAGITVKSLHHYDRIGLLQPTANRESGHRLYGHKDLERLQQILCFKSMGFSLSEIAKCLDEDAYDLQQTLRLQKKVIGDRAVELKRIDELLSFMLVKMEQEKELTNTELLRFMKEVQKMESLYTPEQLKDLRDRYAKFPEKVKEVEKAWPVLFKKFEEAMKAGLEPSDPKVQVLARQAQEYIDMFTGGDKAIETNLDKAYTQNREDALKTWGVKEDVFEFATKARKIYLGR